MKKCIKALFAGIGLAVAGVVACALLRSDWEAVTALANGEWEEEEACRADRAATREFIERRKKRAAEMRKASQGVQGRPSAPSGDGENLKPMGAP